MVALAAFLATAMSLPSPDVDSTTKQQPKTAPVPPPMSQDQRMAWWREARFGLFIHWGLYAVPAGKWGDRNQYGEWIREEAHIPISEYEKLLAQFNPVKFDPDQWTKLAREAGMKYLVITSKHHDGFCLFDSRQTEWDVMSTPYKKDILKMLSAACQKNGIRFCTYHSIMDWHHPDYLPKRGWEQETWRQSSVEKADLTSHKPDFSKFVQYLHSQVAEVATNYRPGVMWFDGQWEATWNTTLGKDLLALCRRLNTTMIVNNRVNSGPGGGGDFGTPEQFIPATGLPGQDWETCMTMNGHWGYCAADLNYKSTQTIVRNLLDIVSKGGNYLLNIGPTAEGEFPPLAVQRLKEIGAWMKVNGEAIYGTTASPFKKLDWGRCTQKPGPNGTTILYLSVFDWPKDGKLRVPGLGNEVTSARVLGAVSKLDQKRDGSDVVVSVPAAAPDPIATVVKVIVKGKPMVYDAPEIVSESEQFVDSLKVELKASPGLEIRYTTDGSDPTVSNKSNMTYRTYISLTETTTIKARSYHKGKAVSDLVERRFEKVQPMPAKNVGELKPGLEVRMFEGDWNKLPEFYFETKYTTKDLPSISIADDPKKEFCGRLYAGVFLVDADAMYRFSLTSDDGSRLWVDGALVVNNDGLHSTETQYGAIALAKGWHHIGVEWFNKTGGAELEVKMGPIGTELKAIPAERFGH